VTYFPRIEHEMEKLWRKLEHCLKKVMYVNITMDIRYPLIGCTMDIMYLLV
jgi:hypothetical protein